MAGYKEVPLSDCLWISIIKESWDDKPNPLIDYRIGEAYLISNVCIV